MWIETNNSKAGPGCINSKYIRVLRVAVSRDVRSYASGSGSVLHHTAPDHDFCVVAYLSAGPMFLTGGISHSDAQALLHGILEAIERRARVFCVARFLRTLRTASRDGPKKVLTLPCNPPQPGDTPAITPKEIDP